MVCLSIPLRGSKGNYSTFSWKSLIHILSVKGMKHIYSSEFLTVLSNHQINNGQTRKTRRKWVQRAKLCTRECLSFGIFVIMKLIWKSRHYILHNDPSVKLRGSGTSDYRKRNNQTKIVHSSEVKYYYNLERDISVQIRSGCKKIKSNYIILLKHKRKTNFKGKSWDQTQDKRRKRREKHWKISFRTNPSWIQLA